MLPIGKSAGVSPSGTTLSSVRYAFSSERSAEVSSLPAAVVRLSASFCMSTCAVATVVVVVSVWFTSPIASVVTGTIAPAVTTLPSSSRTSSVSTS